MRAAFLTRTARELRWRAFAQAALFDRRTRRALARSPSRSRLQQTYQSTGQLVGTGMDYLFGRAIA
jgi:hypothetical protein